jgi:hypothetical protein
VYEGKAQSYILLLQVSSHDFEPTFTIFFLNWRILPVQPKWKQITKPLTRNKHLSLLYFWLVDVSWFCRSLKCQLSHLKFISNKCKLKCQNEFFENYFWNLETSVSIFYIFITEIYLTNIWCDNWWSIFDVVKGLRYWIFANCIMSSMKLHKPNFSKQKRE